MKRWIIGGGAIALLTCTPALGQTFQNRFSEPIYQPQYQFQSQPRYRSQYQPRYQPRYSPQSPVIYITPGSTAIIIYPNSPYSNRPSYSTAPYERSVPIYPAARTYDYPTSIRSNSIRSNSNSRGISVPWRSRSAQPYPLQTIYPAPYPYGAQVYPIYGSPYRR